VTSRNDALTYGLDIHGDFIALEKFSKKASVYKNTTVISFFDCCRTFSKAKGEES
jgi:hypothetical protein